jgi:hypothetical protein
MLNALCMGVMKKVKKTKKHKKHKEAVGKQDEAAPVPK